MPFPVNVERWRYNVQIAVTQSSFKGLHDPVIILADVNIGAGEFINYVLGIIQKESAGNEFALGDLKPGMKIPRQPKNIIEAAQDVDKANSIGLMQLNYGVGTPQDMGYAGDKLGLCDGDTNIYYGVQYFLHQLNRYKNSESPVNLALSAYNAGHAIESNKASYVDAIISFVTDAFDAVDEKKT